MEIINFSELLNSHPGLAEKLPAAWGEDDFEEYMESLSCDPDDDEYENEDFEVEVFRGDVDLDSIELTMNSVVIGNAYCKGRFPNEVIYVSGDVYCDSILLTPYWQHQAVVDGTIHAATVVYARAPDHEAMIDLAPNKIKSPLLFGWYANVDQLSISPETTIFLRGDWDYCQQLQLPNLTFAWHGEIYALRDDHCPYVENEWDDDGDFFNHTVEQSVREGRSIWREGFDPVAVPWCKKGKQAARAEEYLSAYLFYRESLRLAPSYYPAALGMATALWHAGAYRQALPAYTEAAKLFPSQHTSLMNKALRMSGMCALRSGELDVAVQVGEQLIEAYQDKADGYRIRGEALLRIGNIDAAQANLEQAISIEPKHGPANWLLGKVLHIKGQLKEAAEQQALAVGVFSKLKLPFDESDGTCFMSLAPSEVDWEERDLSSAIQEDTEEYWRHVMENSADHEITAVPEQFRTANLLLDLLNRRDVGWAKSFAPHFPAAAFTDAVNRKLISCSPANLQFIPKEACSKSLLLTPSEGSFNGFLCDAPPELIDEEVCRHAARGGESPANIPSHLIDKAMCLDSVKARSYNLKEVPALFLDEEFFIHTMAYADQHYIINYIPNRYYETPYLLRAVKENMSFMDNIPGRLANEEVVSYARSLYGEHEGWAAIEARHTPDYWKQHHGESFADICWVAFWDEKTTLSQIKRKESRLSPYQIPRNHYNQAIAEAAFWSEPIHLPSIPTKFYTPKIIDAFLLQYGDKLPHIPIAMRTPERCSAAVADDRVMWFYIPSEYHAATADLLLEDMSKVSFSYLSQCKLSAIKLFLMCANRDFREREVKTILEELNAAEQAADEHDSSAQELGVRLKAFCFVLLGDNKAARDVLDRAGIIGSIEELYPRGDFRIFEPYLELSKESVTLLPRRKLSTAKLLLERARGRLLLESADIEGALADLKAFGKIANKYDDVKSAARLKAYCQFLLGNAKQAKEILNNAGINDSLEDLNPKNKKRLFDPCLNELEYLANSMGEYLDWAPDEARFCLEKLRCRVLETGCNEPSILEAIEDANRVLN